MRERLWQGLAALGGALLNGAAAPRLPGILNVSFEEVHGESLVGALSALAVTTGSACSSESAEPSYVLRALGRSTQLAQSSLRFSLGRPTLDADVDLAVAAVGEALAGLRALSPAAPGARSHRSMSTSLPAAAVVSGEAGGRGQETWVRFHLVVAGGTVKEARFQAFACPHTTEVAAWLCGELPGRTREQLIPGTPSGWAQALGVPAEKLGRLLVVEDALRACLAHWG